MSNHILLGYVEDHCCFVLVFDGLKPYITLSNLVCSYKIEKLNRAFRQNTSVEFNSTQIYNK